LQLGDKYTMFFYSAVKTGQSKNHISQLITVSGEAVFDITTLKFMAPAFYKNLIN